MPRHQWFITRHTQLCITARRLCTTTITALAFITGTMSRAITVIMTAVIIEAGDMVIGMVTMVDIGKR